MSMLLTENPFVQRYLAKCTRILEWRGVSRTQILETLEEMLSNIEESHQEKAFSSYDELVNRFGSETTVLESYDFKMKVPWWPVLRSIFTLLIFLFPIFFFLAQIGFNYYIYDTFSIAESQAVSRFINNQIILFVVFFQYYALQFSGTNKETISVP